MWLDSILIYATIMLRNQLLILGNLIKKVSNNAYKLNQMKDNNKQKDQAKTELSFWEKVETHKVFFKYLSLLILIGLIGLLISHSLQQRIEENQKSNDGKNQETNYYKNDSLNEEFKLSGGAPSGGEYIPVSKTNIGYKLNGKVEAETQILKDEDVLYWYDGKELNEIDLMDVENLNLTEFKRVAGNIVIAADKIRIEDSFKE
eukprot:TRINITY_DN390943_c0_g1_i1.p1 TRINITY_DN390943_c0_g1~~TRINITY_DN390943_c0_g1_i1.p1  ORF type:complete len:203 (-),score=39.40 TRINITY_DN390943_c0_g1_i1:82-690(-)